MRRWQMHAMVFAWSLVVGAQAFKVYIFADMEGCSGVTGSVQIADGAEEGRRLMEGDINACVTGCYAAGATQVVVRDGHAQGCNVDPARLDPRVRLIQGATPGVRLAGLESSEAVILLGYHAKSLTLGGVLAHTYSSARIQRMRLNAREVGEIGVDAVIAGEHGVPVVLVTGDDKVAQEAEEWIPGVLVCVVKTGLTWQSAVCLPLDKAREKIRRWTEQALRRRANVRPVRVERPVTLEWEYLPPGSLRTHHPEFRPVETPLRMVRTGDSVEALLLSPPR